MPIYKETMESLLNNIMFSLKEELKDAGFVAGWEKIEHLRLTITTPQGVYEVSFAGDAIKAYSFSKTNPGDSKTPPLI